MGNAHRWALARALGGSLASVLALRSSLQAKWICGAPLIDRDSPPGGPIRWYPCPNGKSCAIHRDRKGEG